MCKLDLSETCFCVPTNKNTRKLVQFRCSDNLYEFMCLFCSRACTPIFFKIMKILAALLWFDDIFR